MFRSGVIELFVCGGNPIDNGNAWYTSTRSRRHNDGAGSPYVNTHTRLLFFAGGRLYHKPALLEVSGMINVHLVCLV